MPFCQKCGTEVPEKVQFCQKCGNNLQGGQNPNDNTTPASTEKANFAPNIDIAAVVAEKAHTISMSGFILICLCFLLPFINVQCGNNKVLELKGYHMVSGYELQNNLTQTKIDDVEPNPFAITMLISALIGVILCNRLKNKKGILKFFIINLAAVILLMLRIIHLFIEGGLDGKAVFKDEEAVFNNIVTVDYGIGYWLCVFLSFALIAFAFYMIKSTKRQTIIGSIPLVVICFLTGVCFATNPFIMPPKAKASELGLAAETWIKIQKAYIIELDKPGHCQEIGYTPPGNGESAYFTYECGILPNGSAYWTAKNHVDLGECKAGSKWVVNMNRDIEIMLKQPDDKKCAELTPNFCRLATSGKCVNMQEERAKEEEAEKERERALAEKEAEEKALADNMHNATAELEQEAKKWQGSFNDGGSNSYKATEGQFFKFNSKNGEDGDIIWTATSKVNIGDCPANSVWKMLNACEGVCYWSNQVPSNCEPITPKTISSYSGSDDVGEDGYH